MKCAAFSDLVHSCDHYTTDQHELQDHPSSSPTSTASETLHVKYKPRNMQEIIGHVTERKKLLHLISTGVSVTCVGPSGVGLAHLARLCISEASYSLKEISCTCSIKHTVQLLKDHQRDICKSLCSSTHTVAFLLVNVDHLTRNERAQLTSAMANKVCVVVSEAYVLTTESLNFSRPSPAEIATHLCWIAAEENLAIDDTEALRYADCQNVRAAIEALSIRSLFTIDRVPNLSDAQRLHTARDTLPFSHISVCSDYLDMMLTLDTSPHLPEWYYTALAIIKNISIDCKSFSILGKHAQLKSRQKQLTHSSNVLGFNKVHLHEYALLVKTYTPDLTTSGMPVTTETAPALAILSRLRPLTKPKPVRNKTKKKDVVSKVSTCPP